MPVRQVLSWNSRGAHRVKKRTGDTAGIWIIGRPTNIHKILRIYNPATTTVFYTDMPLQSVVNTDNGHDIYRIGETGAEKQVSRQPRIAAYLTESGTINDLPVKLQEVAVARLLQPELTLSELAATFDPPLTKSCLNHRIRKLMEISRALKE